MSTPIYDSLTNDQQRAVLDKLSIFIKKKSKEQLDALIEILSKIDILEYYENYSENQKPVNTIMVDSVQLSDDVAVELITGVLEGIIKEYIGHHSVEYSTK